MIGMPRAGGGGAIRAKNECAGDPGIIACSTKPPGGGEAGVQIDLLIPWHVLPAAEGVPGVSRHTSGAEHHRRRFLEHLPPVLGLANKWLNRDSSIRQCRLDAPQTLERRVEACWPRCG